jgi:hypothetical protein
MKRIIAICFTPFFVCLCFAQSGWSSVSDSIAFESRRKAVSDSIAFESRRKAVSDSIAFESRRKAVSDSIAFKSRINAVIDSMSFESRRKADIVLSYFDTIRTNKMLYSIKDKFYVLINRQSYYEEYYLVLDTANKIKTIELLKKDKIKTRKQKNQQKHLEEILKEAEPIFDLSKYHTGYITKGFGTSYTFGMLSYFVVKDIDGNRYGEYHLFMHREPMPINPSLWVYLVRRLSER